MRVIQYLMDYTEVPTGTVSAEQRTDAPRLPRVDDFLPGSALILAGLRGLRYGRYR